MSTGARFGISAMVVRQLGEQLISDEVTALVELVKNAYDADASFALVEVSTEGTYAEDELHFPVVPGGKVEIPNDITEAERRRLEGAVAPGYILVRDDGTGMDRDEIEEGWLTISLSKKRAMKREGVVTPKRNRTPLGDKGLGRLSTQRLGARLEMFTVKEIHDESSDEWVLADEEHHVAVNWDEFHDDVLLRNVPVYLAERQRDPSRRGTRLVVTGLRDPSVWLGTAQEALVGRLTQIISPFQAERPFRVFLSINGTRFDFERLTQTIRDVALSTHEFVYDGDHLHIEGRIKLSVLRGNNDRMREEYRQLVGNDLGVRFFEFLRDEGKAIPGIEYIEGPEWFISYRISLDARTLGLETRDESIVDPGPFMGEIDQFGYEGVELGEARDVFGRIADYKKYLRSQAGVRVYRDGFGIRPYGFGNNDWLGIREEVTSGRSFYGLRPKNIIGYVAITSKDNPLLEEKTDREGFTETPASNNFMTLMGRVRSQINGVFTTLRRSYNEYKKEHQAELRGILSTEALFEELRDTSAQSKALGSATEELQITEVAASLGEALEQVHAMPDAGGDPKLRVLLERTAGQLVAAQDVVRKAAIIRERAGRLDEAADYLETQLEVLRGQLDDFSELAGLGITAEALSHELENLIDRLSIETKQLIDSLKRRKIVVAEVTAYTEYVRSAVSTLRKQLSHLSPSLRYVRERRDTIHTASFFEEAARFYESRKRFRQHNMRFWLDSPFEDFPFQMNRGKFTQVVDNLVLNSEYWLAEAVGQGLVENPAVSVRSQKPYVDIYDNGLGIDPAVEPMLFQPFVTTKPRGVGRGLGLFITQQLLDSEGCSVYLLPDLNQHGRKYVFQIDLTGALHGRK